MRCESNIERELAELEREEMRMAVSDRTEECDVGSDGEELLPHEPEFRSIERSPKLAQVDTKYTTSTKCSSGSDPKSRPKDTRMPAEASREIEISSHPPFSSWSGPL